MSSPRKYTDDDIARWAPDTGVLHDARRLERKFTSLGVSADGTWLLGKCQGSGKEPYQVSIDLADPDSPTFRCNCPSRKFPCKHGLGLMCCWVKDSKKFKEEEPSADLLAKREKKGERDKKKAETLSGAVAETAGDPTSSGPQKKTNTAAQKKKIAAQKDGLELLEKLLLDLASSGQWFEETRLEKLRRQAPQLGDAYLNSSMYLLNRLVLLGEMEDLGEEERMARGADLVAQLWATTQRGKAYLENQLGADENQADADAVMESILGRTWKLTELKEQGYWGSHLKLLELAFERYDDHARAQRIEISHLLELNDGRCFQAVAFRPFKGMQYIAEQPSYSQTLTISEGAIYPGYINRRVRWDKTAEAGADVTKADLQQAYGKALPELKPAFDALKGQMKHPLAPREATFLVQVQKIAPVGDRIVLEDGKGLRVEATNRPRDDAPLDSRKRGPSKKKKANAPEPVNLDCLLRAAGEFGGRKPALLLRLYLLPVAARIVAEPLALLTPEHHLRLGF